MDEPSQPRLPEQPPEPPLPAQRQPDRKLVVRWIALMVAFFGLGFLLTALFVFREVQRIKRIKEETEKNKPKAQLAWPARRIGNASPRATDRQISDSWTPTALILNANA